VGNTLKLRGTPKASDTKPCQRKCKAARLIASGKVKALKMIQWTIRSQGPKSLEKKDMGQVQRLDGGGSRTVA
jgi:hypothetical protein